MRIRYSEFDKITPFNMHTCHVLHPQQLVYKSYHNVTFYNEIMFFDTQGVKQIPICPI